MAVVTFSCPIGAGGNEVGVLTARLLNANYVDRLILAEAARRVGSTVAALSEKDERVIRRRHRVAYLLQNLLERSAMSGAAGLPYFSQALAYLPAEEYTDLVEEPITAAQRLKDQQFIEVTSAVINDLATAGEVVIIGRGSNIILKDMPGVLHVGLIAPPELRIRTIIERQHLKWSDAEKYMTDMEKARIAYFRKFFKVRPDDPNLYHMVLNMGTVSVNTAAKIVAHSVGNLASD